MVWDQMEKDQWTEIWVEQQELLLGAFQEVLKLQDKEFLQISLEEFTHLSQRLECNLIHYSKQQTMFRCKTVFTRVTITQFTLLLLVSLTRGHFKPNLMAVNSIKVQATFYKFQGDLKEN
jgi:hypothetical protein